MKPKYILAISTVLVMGALAGWTTFAGDEPNQSEAESATTSTFRVTGMTCGGCEVGVRRVVNKLEGIEDVEASHEEGTATVTYRADEVTPDDIIAAIEELGYTAELITDGEPS